MNYIFDKLEPKNVWLYFNEILQIPNASGNISKIKNYLIDFGKKNKLETLSDEIGNVLIRKNATKGYEKLKSVVLQGHMDMVCEKNNDVKFNFDTDAIIPIVENGWVKAKGTTLGADNGIALAAMMAVLGANNIEHGPIECLFTVDEEIGLIGAFDLKTDFLKSEILLNLDSEDEGEFCIGCAGGNYTNISVKYKNEAVDKNNVAIKINVKGLLGGHSGDEINKNRGNSIKIINRIVWNLNRSFKISLSSINGGNLSNAIPRESECIIVADKNDVKNIKKQIIENEKLIKNELSSNEPNFEVKVKEVTLPDFVIDNKTKDNLLNSLYACPHGVIAMSTEIPGLVETSTNLALVKTLSNTIEIKTSQRSAIDSAKADVSNMINGLFSISKAKIEHTGYYPGWKPNPSSEIVKIMVNSYKKLYKKEPKVLAIHAGLECGVIGEKYPKMEMISFGPTIKAPHSPDERMDIVTVKLFWDLLLDVLKNIPKK